MNAPQDDERPHQQSHNPTHHKSPRPAPQGRKPRPGLLGRAEAAAYLGIGVSTLDSLCRCGDVPAPVRLGGKVCWSRVELAHWCAHGCPNRAKWATVWVAIRAARMAKQSLR